MSSKWWVSPAGQMLCRVIYLNCWLRQTYSFALLYSLSWWITYDLQQTCVLSLPPLKCFRTAPSGTVKTSWAHEDRTAGSVWDDQSWDLQLDLFLDLQIRDCWLRTSSLAAVGYNLCYLHNASVRCENGKCVDWKAAMAHSILRQE